MTKKWSDEAWAVSAHIYQEILKHPFVKGLADGTLPYDRFIRYLRQDALYIDNYCKVLSHIASRLDNPQHVEAFVKFAMDGIYVEKMMHESFLKGDCPLQEEKSPSCLLYTSLLSAQALAPVEVEAAAVLPCFWVYQRVGEKILKSAEKNNPFYMWIETYGDKAFEESTRQAVAICDSLAEKAGKSVRKAMTDIFVMCTRMEWMFWDSAWNLDDWKI